MSKTDVTAEEIAWSITGFDKIAIIKAFGMSLPEIQKAGDNMELVRVFAYVDMKHRGTPDKEAREQALNLTVRDLTNYFPEPESDEELGKGETP